MQASITVSELKSALTGPQPPLVIDVRRVPAFRAASDMIAGALRRDPAAIASWAKALPRAASVVTYCVHGHEVSQNAAAGLRELGLTARYLEGGLEEGWKGAGGTLDWKPAMASTRWITRERPKIDRIACPWLIARFVDAEAEFLYVPSETVLETAREREGVPYDVPGVAFSHDGELCSFDAFIRHYRLRDPALARLALIVRGADTGKLDLAPQSPGLAAISLGLSLAGIVSHRSALGSLHLNGALQYTREHEPSAFLGAILEGPNEWTVRPVMELTGEQTSGAPRAYSRLVA